MNTASNSIEQQSDWIEVGSIYDIPRQGARVIERAEGDIAVFRTIDDKVFALHDKCPHKGGPLSQGIVHDNRVTCPMHDWKINLETGEAVAPDEGRTSCFDVRIEQDKIYLNLVANSADSSCSE